MIEEFGLTSGYDMFIGNADYAQRAKNLGLHQEGSHPASHPAVNAMLFDRDHRPGTCRSLFYRFLIEGAQGMQAQNAACDPLAGQELVGQVGRSHSFTGCNECDIAAFARRRDLNGFSNFKMGAWSMQDGHGFLAKTDINGPGMFCSHPDGLGRLKIIGRSHDIDIIDGLQRSKIVQGMMGAA